MSPARRTPYFAKEPRHERTHPSGETRPSRADEVLTSTLKTALSLVDVRVLDHIITAGGTSASMAELGLI